MRTRLSLALIALFFAALHVFVLPPDGFVTGDQGSKFLQTRAFAEQGPLNPGIEVRARDIDPEYRRQEPKLKNRRGRLVSEFLWLLPLMSAPFMRLLGMRGLYVVPALSVLVIFLAAAALGRRTGDERGLWTAWIVLLTTPVVVYGLELWEHAPAAACVLVAAVLLAPAKPRRGDGGGLRFVAAGAAIAIGALFREEVVPAFPALLVGRAIALERDRLKDVIATGLWTGLGALVVFVASVPMNMVMYGAPLPMHVTQDAWEVARNTPYMQVRREMLVELLLPASHVGLFAAAMVAALGASMVEAWRRRPRTGSGDRVSRALLRVVHVASVVIVFIVVVLPLWRLAHGVRPHVSYKVTSAAHTWVFALAVLYWPWIAVETYRPMVRFLIVSALLLLFGTVVIVPTIGGAQWSPRFFLAVAPLLAIVAGAAVRPTPAIAGVRWMAAGILLASFVMQASGMFYIGRAKARQARLTHWVAARTADGDVLISDVFWFPEVTATLAPTRRMLFSWSSADVPEMAAMATARGLRRFGVVTSPLTGYDAPPTLDVPGAPCRFVRGQRIGLDELGLVLNRYGCAEP